MTQNAKSVRLNEQKKTHIQVAPYKKQIDILIDYICKECHTEEETKLLLGIFLYSLMRRNKDLK